jgi:hypothetical protein
MIYPKPQSYPKFTPSGALPENPNALICKRWGLGVRGMLL